MRRSLRLRSTFFALLLVALTAISANAFKGTSLRADFLPNLSAYGFGVSDDGNPVYEDSVGRVQCYFGAGGGNVDLVTYSSARTLHLQFDPAAPAWQGSGLPQTSNVVVDLYGVNFYGLFLSMGVGTTAQVQTSLQFKSGGNTFELMYQSLAAKRLTQNTWLITSDPLDIGGYPGFTASDQAALGVFRRRSRQTFGAVNMPIRFEVTLR